MQTAGVMDLSAAAKFEVIGRDAGTFLNRLSANKLPACDGRLGLSLCHAPEGGIMCEFSVTRLSAEHYYLVSGIGSELKDLQWLEQHADGFEVDIRNVTADLGVLLLTGVLDWEDVLKEKKAYNALDACKHLGLDEAGLDANDRRFHSHYYPRRLPAEVLADAIAKATAVELPPVEEKKQPARRGRKAAGEAAPEAAAETDAPPAGKSGGAGTPRDPQPFLNV
jgi:folate-binding Fe-S cluster repair protein YgfZ